MKTYSMFTENRYHWSKAGNWCQNILLLKFYASSEFIWFQSLNRKVLNWRVPFSSFTFTSKRIKNIFMLHKYEINQCLSIAFYVPLFRKNTASKMENQMSHWKIEVHVLLLGPYVSMYFKHEIKSLMFRDL